MFRLMSSSATGPTILRTSDPYVTNSIRSSDGRQSLGTKKLKHVKL